MREKREIVKKLKQLNDKLESVGLDVEQSDVIIEKAVKVINEELTPKERLLLYKIIIQEFSYRAMVEKPEFMIKQNNVVLRSILFSGLIFGLLTFITALLFSNGPLVASIKDILYHILNITKTK